jgi:hypothetical protein
MPRMQKMKERSAKLLTNENLLEWQPTSEH